MPSGSTAWARRELVLRGRRRPAYLWLEGHYGGASSQVRLMGESPRSCWIDGKDKSTLVVGRNLLGFSRTSPEVVQLLLQPSPVPKNIDVLLGDSSED